MIRALAKLVLGKRWLDPKSITPERVRQVFLWSELAGPIGAGKQSSDKLAESITIERQPEDIVYRKAFRSFKVGQEVHYPAHLSWTHYKEAAYVALVEGRVEIRYTRTGENLAEARPATITMSGRIAGIFEEWYHHLGLPETLDTLRAENEARTARKGLGGSRIEWLGRYIAGEIPFSGLTEREGILLWVDWRASDDEIVEDCERLLETGKLSAEFVENDVSADLFITFGAKRTRVPYPAPEADRDSTLIALNKAIMPGYELRFAIESEGSDTLAFLPLKKADWKRLERDHPAEVAKKFRTVAERDKFFG